MKFLFTVCFSLSTFVLQANAILLDDVMTQEEQKKTGVSRLTTQQKIELENWMNRTFVLKTNPSSNSQTLYLSINIDGGAKLRLSDNSLWQVAPSDVPQAAGWLLPVPLEIQESKDPQYPYYLVNPQTQEKVKVKKLSS